MQFELHFLTVALPPLFSLLFQSLQNADQLAGRIVFFP
jgi:hypothetical protein